MRGSGSGEVRPKRGPARSGSGWAKGVRLGRGPRQQLREGLGCSGPGQATRAPASMSLSRSGTGSEWVLRGSGWLQPRVARKAEQRGRGLLACGGAALTDQGNRRNRWSATTLTSTPAGPLLRLLEIGLCCIPPLGLHASLQPHHLWCVDLGSALPHASLSLHWALRGVRKLGALSRWSCERRSGLAQRQPLGRVEGVHVSGRGV
jgi:hypothetical protein